MTNYMLFELCDVASETEAAFAVAYENLPSLSSYIFSHVLDDLENVAPFHQLEGDELTVVSSVEEFDTFWKLFQIDQALAL